MDFLKPIDVEREVIGSALDADAQRLSSLDLLSSSDFSDASFARLFDALQAVRAASGRLSLEGLDAACVRLYGADAAASLMDTAMSARLEFRLNVWRLPEAVQTVREAAQRRKLIGIGEAVLQAAHDPVRTVDEIVDSVRTSIHGCARSSGGWVTLNDAVLTAYEGIERQEEAISTGIGELDRILCGGLHRCELTLLGARPSVGKSSVLLQMGLTAAQEGHRAAFVSLEMNEASLGLRVLAARSGLNLGALRSGKDAVRDGDWARLSDALTLVGADNGAGLDLLVRAGLAVEELRSEVQSRVEDGCELLLIDYAQLLHVRKRCASEYEKLSAVSRALKGITLDFNLPVVAAAQVNRASAQGGAVRAPTLAELRGSGSFEQDADNVILLHRVDAEDDTVLASDSYRRRHAGLWEESQRLGKQLLVLDVAKQRQGMTARAWTVFDAARMNFINQDNMKYKGD